MDIEAPSDIGAQPDDARNDVSTEARAEEADGQNTGPQARKAEPFIDPPEMVIGSWNLKNFSPYGTQDFRIEDIADHIEDLQPDVLAIQELKVREGSEGDGQQAWDALLGELEGYEGIANPYNPIDSVVGLIYRPEHVQVIAHKALFVGQWWPFPRAPLEVTLRIEREGRSITMKVIVVHLKAFPEGADRREEACEDLHAYLKNGLAQTTLIVGDFNDTPTDPPEDNVFASTFLDPAGGYDFITADLPLGTVTTLGYPQRVNGVVMYGEFLDHGVATERLHTSYTDITAEVVDRPVEEYGWYEDTYSDHFPVLLHFTP